MTLLLVLYSLSLIAHGRRGPGMVWPCQECDDMPVSLDVTTAKEVTNVLFQFRVTTPLHAACVEFLIPSDFTVPNCTLTDFQCVVTQTGFELDGNDAVFLLRNVTNPKLGGSYGPFGIRTRGCCSCQVVDESVNFYFVNIGSIRFVPLNYILTVYDLEGNNVTSSRLQINLPVTLSFHIQGNITPDEQLWATFDPPVWGVVNCSAPAVLTSTTDRWTVISQLEESEEFDVNCNANAPYYAIVQGQRYTSRIRKLAPPVNSTTSANKIVVTEGKNEHVFYTQSGNITKVTFQPTNGLNVSRVEKGGKIYANVTFEVENGLEPKDNVYINMTGVCTGDCLCFVDGLGSVCNCACNNGAIVVGFDKSMQEYRQICVKFLLSLNSSDSFVIQNVTSFDAQNNFIDVARCSASFPLISQENTNFQVLLTDPTGTDLRNTAKRDDVSVQFLFSMVAVPSKQTNFSTATVTCPQSFTLQSTTKVSAQVHSTNFSSDKICNKLQNNANPTLNFNNWEITINVTQFFPVIYGTLVLMVSPVTLPDTASNIHTAYECRITLQNDTYNLTKTRQIDVFPSIDFTANVYYYCFSNIPGLPIGVLLRNNLSFRTGSGMFKLDIEIPVDDKSGFPPMLGSGLANQSSFSHILEINGEQADTSKMVIFGNGDRTVLTVDLPQQASISSLLVKLPVGNRTSFTTNVTIPLRIYYLDFTISLTLKHTVFEAVSVLTAPTGSEPPSTLPLTVSEARNVGQVTVTANTPGNDVRFFWFIFPSNTSLTTVHFSQSSTFTYRVVTWTGASPVLLLATSEPTFTISNIGFRPHYSRKIIAAVSGTAVEQKCIGQVEYDFQTKPSIELKCDCQQTFSLSNVRTSVTVTAQVRSGISANSTMVAPIDSTVWGVKNAECAVNPPAIGTCVFSRELYAVQLTFTEDVLDETFFSLNISKIRLPYQSNQPLFKSVSLLPTDWVSSFSSTSNCSCFPSLQARDLA